MTDHDAMLRPILDNPDDDGPRLIYADWIEQYNGEAERAEFIRTQCTLARMNPGHFTHISSINRPCDCELCTLRRRERELLEKHLGWFDKSLVPWYNPDGRISTGRFSAQGPPIFYRFVRGFPTEIEADWEWWLAHADELVWQKPRKCDQCNATGKISGLYGPTYQCSACRGSGELPGATMPCQNCEGDGRVTPIKNGLELADVPCVNCGGYLIQEEQRLKWGSGRVPRPFSLAMQPITQVTLSDMPNLSTGSRDGVMVENRTQPFGARATVAGQDIRLTEVDCRWEDLPTDYQEQVVAIIERLLGKRWPGIRFHLPEQPRAEPTLGDGEFLRAILQTLSALSSPGFPRDPV